MTVKDSFHFTEEIVDQQPDLFKGSMDADSLFTDITLEETIEIFTTDCLKNLKSLEA